MWVGVGREFSQCQQNTFTVVCVLVQRICHSYFIKDFVDIYVIYEHDLLCFMIEQN